MLQTVLFYLFAVIVVLAALAMILSRNLVHSALYMAVAFLGMAFVYLLLQADYVAVVQILVYVGAISVLFVFGIMLTKRQRMEDSNGFNRYGLIATLVGLALFAIIVRAVSVSSAIGSASAAGSTAGSTALGALPATTAGSAAAISSLFLGDMALPLEAAALLLLGALAGAIAVGMPGRQEKRKTP